MACLCMHVDQHSGTRTQLNEMWQLYGKHVGNPKRSKSCQSWQHYFLILIHYFETKSNRKNAYMNNVNLHSYKFNNVLPVYVIFLYLLVNLIKILKMEVRFYNFITIDCKRLWLNCDKRKIARTNIAMQICYKVH